MLDVVCLKMHKINQKVNYKFKDVNLLKNDCCKKNNDQAFLLLKASKINRSKGKTSFTVFSFYLKPESKTA